MNNIKPVIFLIPVIALTFTAVLYFSLLKKATDKKAFNKFIFTITVLSFLLNFAWELIQIPLYIPSLYSLEHIAFCALASLADAIMVLLLYFGFVLIFRNPLWIKHLNWKRIAAFLSGGQTGEMASAHLNAIHVRHGAKLPWPITFSFARAIQQPAISIWGGNKNNKHAAQQALYHREKCDDAPRRGKYDASMEKNVTNK